MRQEVGASPSMRHLCLDPDDSFKNQGINPAALDEKKGFVILKT